MTGDLRPEAVFTGSRLPEMFATRQVPGERTRGRVGRDPPPVAFIHAVPFAATAVWRVTESSFLSQSLSQSARWTFENGF